MNSIRSYLGKTFISHSSRDKPFVRRLVKRIEEAGFAVWLDEKELLAGDALSRRIAEALRTASVVIVVVSPASVRSKWLKYELNLAAERMVKGACRIVPVVIGDSDLPPEVQGLIYADFRRSFKSGLATVIAALHHEATSQAIDAEPYLRVMDAVESIFGRLGFVSGGGGQYKSIDWQSVSVPVPSEVGPDETFVFYDAVMSHGDPPEPLTALWLNDFQNVLDETGEEFSLIVTARPVAFAVKRPDAGAPQLCHTERFGNEVGTVFVELAGVSEEGWKPLLVRAKELLVRVVSRRATEAQRRGKPTRKLRI